ncbi:unnamed protein product [Microthlaspi erraticum]|uniref:FBD domain-containing protein n=1 Tax=Microthlaspi erraticum TaxID=1685480 RepID=A0A6D2L724_9BRAS|nr:unnamed protein product [Microthlaspi erraticum]
METRKLNELPDELVLKIFSFLPMFKETVATHLLTKHWEEPWELVPDVMFDDDDESSESFEAFMRFVYGSLLSNDAQILESLHLKLSRNCSVSHINFWVKIAVDRSVRKLRVNLSGKTLELPSCLSTCTTLKSLILREVSVEVVTLGFRFPSLKSLHLLSVEFSNDDDSVTSLLQSCPVLEYLVVHQTKDDVDVMFKAVPSGFSLPSLKSVHLLSVKFSDDESLASLLQNCLVLEDLAVKKTKDDNVMIFNINVPTLKSLSVDNSKGKRDYVEEIHGFVINAPSLEKLNFKDTCSNFLTFEYMPEVIKANIQQHGSRYNDRMNPWDKPTDVPDCLSKNLEVLEWRQYEGTEKEREVAAYILANATCLKMATFSTRCRNKYHRMLRKLKKMHRVSETCQLVFE